MVELRDRVRVDPPSRAGLVASGPVVLGTLSVRVDPRAERMATESALEAGVGLIVANMLALGPYPATLMLVGPGGVTLPHEEDLAAVRATAQRAADLGIRTELLRISTRRPVAGLLELAAERRAGLLVFGPDPNRMRPWRLRRAARRVRAGAGCLVWVPPLATEA